MTATSALLEAKVNPNGAPTSYHFEYLTEAEYEADGDGFSGPDPPILAPPDGSAGAGSGEVPVSVLVQGLTPGVVYRYRLVAESEPNSEPLTVAGAGETFTTRSGAGAGLIDGRGSEQVSPVDKHGVALEAITIEGGDIQAAAGGEGLAYIAKGPPDGDPAGSREFAEQQLLAAHGSGGWGTQDLTAAHESVAALVGGYLSEYELFSPDLSVGALEPADATPLSPQATEYTPYLRHTGDGEYEPLVDPEDVTPPGTKFGRVQSEGSPGLYVEAVEFLSATPDFSRVLLSARRSSLVAGFNAPEKTSSLYEWDAAKPASERLIPVSILPDGESAATTGQAEGGFGDRVLRHAVSENGERVFFGVGGSLYMRNLAAGTSLRLDVPEPGAEGGKQEAVFQDASADGARVFFLDGARLTKNASSREGKRDLYMCDVGAIAPGEQDCARHLTDLTVEANHGEAAEVVGDIVGVSETGVYAYFVANGVLGDHGSPVAGAVRGDCEQTSDVASHSCNLYVWHEGEVALVGVLSGRDEGDWGEGVGISLGKLTARVSPDGRYLAFMSERSLTGFDNRDLYEGPSETAAGKVDGPYADQEVYLYHAAGTGGEALSLACASCDPSGARPAGILDHPTEHSQELLVDRQENWSGHWLAGSLPGWTPVTKELALYQSRYLGDEGRLFFDSPAGLVPAGANGKEDVYEYEPTGVGGCTSAAASEVSAVKPAHAFVGEGRSGEEGAGCVGLISSGASGEESAFLDASESGDDVFFLTAARLAPTDVDHAIDVYDAHVCGIGWACPAGPASVPPACTNADSCRAAAEPQPEVFGAPASATFSGPGNPAAPPQAKPKAKPLTRAQKLTKALKACRKDRKKAKRQACERAAHRRYAPLKKTTRSRGNGRGKS